MSGPELHLDRLFSDTDWSGEAFRPYTTGVIARGKQGRLLTTVHVPGGAGPHPAVIFCHGMPGTERLVEFCTALRQVGFLTVHFHYSGSWGSDGTFSLDHCYEDANTILDLLLEDLSLGCDVNHIFAVGHSMGGLIAAKLIALRPEVRGGALIVPASYGYKYRRAMESPEAEAAFQRSYDNYGVWLQGFGWKSVKEEVSRDPDSYDLEYYAPILAKKPLLAVAASMDEDIPRGLNVDRLTAAILAQGENRLVACTLATNHSLSDQRSALKSALAEFLAGQL